MPLISVVMPYFNSETTIAEAIESILSQTEADFEFIAINDGSTDASLEIVRSYAAKDSRIVVAGEGKNRGVVERLNEGMHQVGSDLIARMDADDVSFPHRFAYQTAYLERHKSVNAISSAIIICDAGGRTISSHQPNEPGECDPYEVPAREPYLPHPFMMVRTSALKQINGYRHVYLSEDADLCWRMQECGKIVNDKVLIGKYRRHSQSISSKNPINGRLQMVYAQLSAISAQRRREGRSDIAFSLKSAQKSQENAANLQQLINFATFEYGLNEKERAFLGIASAVKYIQTSEWRHYDIEPVDVAFVGRALSTGFKLYAAGGSRHNILKSYRMAFRRMRRSRRWADAFRLLLPKLFFASRR